MSLGLDVFVYTYQRSVIAFGAGWRGWNTAGLEDAEDQGEGSNLLLATAGVLALDLSMWNRETRDRCVLSSRISKLLIYTVSKLCYHDLSKVVKAIVRYLNT